MKRNLSGIYFRAKKEDGSFDNVVFEELTEEQQDEILNKKGQEWLKSMCKSLANTLKRIGDEVDIVST